MSSQILRISELSASGLPKIGGIQHTAHFYIQIAIDNQKPKQTSVSNRSDSPAWSDSFQFDIAQESLLKLTVYAERTFHSDQIIGEIEVAVASLKAVSSEKVSRALRVIRDPRSANTTSAATVQFKVLLSGNEKDLDETVGKGNEATSGLDHPPQSLEKRLEEAVERAHEAMRGLDEPPPALEKNLEEAVAKAHHEATRGPDGPPKTLEVMETAIKDIEVVTKGINAIAASWSPLMKKIDVLKKLVDNLADVHPFVKMAWNLLSAAYQIVIEQKERDERLHSLIKTMNDAYDFVHATEPLKQIEAHKETLASMALQTVECAYVILQYSADKSFAWRAVKHIASTFDDTLQMYMDTFRQLKSAFLEQAAVRTEITVLQILGVTQNIAADVTFSGMQYPLGAGYNPERGCIPNTRSAILDDISQWVNNLNENVPRIYWLTGVAGVGKSAIAHSMAERFHRLKRLGSSFFFDAGHQSERRPDQVFSKMSRDFAGLNSHWKQKLWEVVKDDPDLCSTASIQRQFDNFLLKPAKDLELVGPILFIIDAADECGGADVRKQLVATLSKRVEELPPNFRILLTSRPEFDLTNAFRDNKQVIYQDLQAASRKSTDGDISVFVFQELALVPDLEQIQLSDHVRKIVQKSEGIFQWAYTACKFIAGEGTSGLDPLERLEMLQSSSQIGGLDQLYMTILNRIFGFNPKNADGIEQHRFKTIMGRILAVREPLSMTALAVLGRDGETVNSVKRIVQPMGSLLSGVSNVSQVVQPLHTSFRDFLTDSSRSGQYYIDTSPQQADLAHASFRTMKNALHFNICKLETSHVPNNAVTDLRGRILKYIPEPLSYACRLWPDHVQASEFSLDSEKEIQEFLESRFLCWLEVLSFTETVDVACQQLRRVTQWILVDHLESTALALLADARRFISVNSVAISESAAHIYLSALSFAPPNCLLAKIYRPQYSQIVSNLQRSPTDWPSVEFVIERRGDSIYMAIAFDNGGAGIVSISSRGDIRHWNANTGAEVSSGSMGFDTPSQNLVSAAAFSPDGQCIAYALLQSDNTIHMWTVHAEIAVSREFKGHTDLVQTIAFSPGGSNITSGSSDTTVRIWSTITGADVFGPLKGHESGVLTVAYSSDGKYIASGSWDFTIRVWDAGTGALLSGPFAGIEGGVTAVNFSPDGRLIVSGSCDNTVRLWNAETGIEVLEPLQGHTDSVQSVAFSANGKRVASGSWDMTIRVWDSDTGALVSGPFKGHSNWVTVVAFSPDGKRIASSSQEAIWVWDADTPPLQEEKFDCHSDAVTSVSTSPSDGKHVASGSYDGTVRVWDAETGASVMGPFQGHSHWVNSVAFSLDGKAIVSGSFDNTIWVWDCQTKTGAAVLGASESFRNDGEPVTSVAFSADGTRIVSASWDGVFIWDAHAGGVLFGPLHGHSTDQVNSVAFSQSGNTIASGSDDSTVCVWDANTGVLVLGPLKGHTSKVLSVAFSPNGKRIVSGSLDKTICVWDSNTGLMVSGPLNGHEAAVRSVAFSPDGKSVVSGSADKTIRVWDAETGTLVLGPFEGHTNNVNSVAFSPNGRHIVSGSDDHSIWMWDINIAKNVLKQRTAGNLSTTLDSQHQSTVARCNRTLENECACFNVTSRLVDGWILGPNDELLFWVPLTYRRGLMRPYTSWIKSDFPIVKLDMSGFVHGESWMDCKSKS